MRFERRSHGFLRFLWIDVADIWRRFVRPFLFGGEA
jgi:hypothetical protein